VQVISSPGATVPTGSFTLQNNCGKAIQVNSLTVGASDIGLVISVSVAGSVNAVSGLNSFQGPDRIAVQPDTAGSATLTLSPPLPINANKTATFDFRVTLSSTPGSSKTSTQTITKVNATANNIAVPVGPLPGTLGTVSIP